MKTGYKNNTEKKLDKNKSYGKKYDKASKYSEIPEYKKKQKEKKVLHKSVSNNKTVRKNKFKNIDEDNINIPDYKIPHKAISKPKKIEEKEIKEGIRLNKYLSNAGIASRREADTLISAGLVSINGKIVTELGIRVMPKDIVKFNNETVNPDKKIYVLLNKPKDYITTLNDPEGRKTVLDLVKDACKERIYPVGRLDRNTTGLLLLTNDGIITEKLSHPKYNKKKIYHVFLETAVSFEDMIRIKEGIELEDGLIAADQIDYVNNAQDEIGIELHSGRNRIVRRIFEHLGYSIKKLDRVYYAGLTKKNLPRGKWRYLTQQEISKLYNGMYE